MHIEEKHLSIPTYFVCILYSLYQEWTTSSANSLILLKKTDFWPELSSEFFFCGIDWFKWVALKS